MNELEYMTNRRRALLAQANALKLMRDAIIQEVKLIEEVYGIGKPVPVPPSPTDTFTDIISQQKGE